MRRAYRDRTIYLGDPGFREGAGRAPDQRRLRRRPARRASIPDKATPSALLPGQPAPLEDDETTHFSIIDGDGNRVAATQTVNLLYGSGMVAPGTGVLLNNEMDDFALRPGTPNAFGVMGFEANAPAARQAHAQFDDANLHRVRHATGRDRCARRQPHHHPGAAGDPRLRRWVERAAGRRVAAFPPPVDAGRDLGRSRARWMPPRSPRCRRWGTPSTSARAPGATCRPWPGTSRPTRWLAAPIRATRSASAEVLAPAPAARLPDGRANLRLAASRRHAAGASSTRPPARRGFIARWRSPIMVATVPRPHPWIECEPG